jgi:hypothetical protein
MDQRAKRHNLLVSGGIDMPDNKSDSERCVNIRLMELALIAASRPLDDTEKREEQRLMEESTLPQKESD